MTSEVAENRGPASLEGRTAWRWGGKGACQQQEVALGDYRRSFAVIVSSAAPIFLCDAY